LRKNIERSRADLVNDESGRKKRNERGMRGKDAEKSINTFFFKIHSFYKCFGF
jgi:hypothetical protein